MEAASVARAIAEDVQLAQQFLGTRVDQRAPWAADYERWADEKALCPELRSATRATIQRLRMFATVDCYRPRARR